MAQPLLSPPPIQSTLGNSVGLPTPAWARWFQQLWTMLHPSWMAAKLIVATSTSTTTDFGAIAVGDKVLILPAAAGNSRFVTVAADGTLPVAAVVGSLYVVMRAF